MSVVDLPQGTGSTILTGFTMAMAKGYGERGLEREKGALATLFSLARLLWSSDAGQRKQAKAMAKVSRMDSPVPPYLTAADGWIHRGGSKSTALMW